MLWLLILFLTHFFGLVAGFVPIPIPAVAHFSDAGQRRRMNVCLHTASPNRQYIFEGMELFRRGDVQGSIDKFDASVPSGSNAYLWQRGISYYYIGEFAKGSKQFRDDVLQSPLGKAVGWFIRIFKEALSHQRCSKSLDVEEIVWDAACLLRMNPDTFPPSNVLSLPKGKFDRRPIMGTVYKLFRGEATEQDLAEAGHKPASFSPPV